MAKIKCQACQATVKPTRFNLWPGMAVNLCPKCRVGLGVLTDAKIKAAEKRLTHIDQLTGREPDVPGAKP